MRTLATFRLFGDPPLSAAHVTDTIEISPTYSHEVGDPISARTSRRRERSAWLLQSSETIEDDVELPTQIERLLAALEPVHERVWQLTKLGYDANWFCYVDSHAAEHAVELDRDLLTRVLALPGALWLDVA